MDERTELRRRIAGLERFDANGFEALAIEVFRYQYAENALYRQFTNLLNVRPNAVRQLTDIPFLPISFFKTHCIKAGNWEAQTVFKSSGTSAVATVSQHHVRDLDWYEELAVRNFEAFYGAVPDWCFLALLPSYLEREGSSLVRMVAYFMTHSRNAESGFFLHNTDALLDALAQIKHTPTVLFGVSFALLDLAAQCRLQLGENVVIMETGGMKGRRRELIRTELHQLLMDGFGVRCIHSEYGMTELFSQAYSQGNGIFRPCARMSVQVRDLTDPLSYVANGRTGALNIVDLANLDTCAFIATDDVGRVFSDGSFEVLGRHDFSEMRGCNLMVV